MEFSQSGSAMSRVDVRMGGGTKNSIGLAATACPTLSVVTDFSWACCRNVLQQYPSGGQFFHEALQNADDTGRASKFRPMQHPQAAFVIHQLNGDGFH
eukprot:2738741-Amphidinium_carterae.1